MVEGLHHFHKRKRVHQNLEPYPNPDKWKRRMDRMIYFVGMIGPIMTIPQILTIWVQRNASGVSAISWASYAVVAVFWIAYGIIHREKPIILAYSIWIVFDIVIVIGTLLYG